MKITSEVFKLMCDDTMRQGCSTVWEHTTGGAPITIELNSKTFADASQRIEALGYSVCWSHEDDGYYLIQPNGDIFAIPFYFAGGKSKSILTYYEMFTIILHKLAEASKYGNDAK